MKKLLALALAVVMMMAIALPVFAAKAEADESESYRVGINNDDSNHDEYLEESLGASDRNDNTSNEVEIKYGVAQAYTVTIPADITLHQATADGDGKAAGMVYGLHTVIVNDVVIAKGERLVIRLTSAATDTDAKAWKLLDTELNNLTGGTAANSDFVNYVIKAVDADAVDTDNYIDEAIDYTALATDDTLLAEGGEILSCAAATGNVSTLGSENTSYLYFSSNGTAQEGTYIDQLTFNVSIEIA